MKKTFLVIIFFLLSGSSFGQKIRFSDSTNEWYNRNLQESSSHVYTFYYQTSNYAGSIEIGGLKYLKLDSTIYIREDTVANKVYMRFNTDTFDRVLYDYNLVEGDTMINYIDPYPYTVITKSWVNGEWSTNINGISYKVWNLHSLLGTSYNVIEGLGCTNGWQFPITGQLYFGGNIQLMCFYNNSSQYTLSNPIPSYNAAFAMYNFSFDNLTSCLLKVEQNNIETSVIRVLPNPIDQTSKIVFPHSMTGSLVINNDIGQAIINTDFRNNEEILIGNKINVPGIYFYRVTEKESGKISSGKFVNR